jgi:SnoaL-like domain
VSDPALTELADRLAIQDLIARYPLAVDGRDWDALDDLFAPGARIDFTAFGGPVGDLTEIKEFLRNALSGFRRTQHMMGLPAITLAGDTAAARTSCNNPMVLDGAAGETSVWLIGLWYDDEFARTPDGWRVTSRKQERNYFITGLKDAPA